ncbi:hypothetical protein LCGC14_1923970, partial [marine sediment metagenome]
MAMEVLNRGATELRSQESHNGGFSRGEMAELSSTIFQIMEEAGLSSGLLDLAIDSVGWELLGGGGTGVLDATNRRGIVNRSRQSAVLDPLCVEALRIWRIFTNGRGISVKAEDEKTQVVLDEFWNAPRNRSVFSVDGINESLDIRNQDGELIFAIFTGDKYGGTTVRRLDTLEITGIVTEQDDAKMVLGYTREYTTKDNLRRKLFYWDIFLPEEGRDSEAIPKDFEEQENVVVHFSKANSRWPRGNPLLLPSLD